MGTETLPETSLRTEVSGQDNGRPAEPSRETNGITSRIVLLYVERVGGASAVDAVLERAGLQGRKEQLLDENYWFSYKEKIALFEAVAEVLDDPEAMLHIGEVVLELNVGEALRLALRALGSPRLVYQNIVRANAKFTGSHRMDLLELGRDYARIRYRDLSVRRRYHPLDCQYNRGLLVCIPKLFGQPPARLSHPVCGCRGGDACVYELRWDERRNDARIALGAGALSVAAAGGAALFAPALLPAAAGLLLLVGAALGWRAVRRDRARWRQVEQELGEQSRLAERLTSSLQDLVSELRIEDVLAKVTRNAQSAVGGKEFALLIDDDDGLGCQSSTGLPRSATAGLEHWADQVGEQLQEPLTVEDVSLVPELLALARDGSPSFGSLCAAPMIFRGERLGVLVALATQPRTFLPRDLDLIQSYATQAAIALTNARLYQSKEELASRDPLTGLLNHREFHEALGRELKRGDRYGGEFSVVLFDIDRFKTVNDMHGHAQGDRVLRDVAGALAGACRASDLAFRIGGDEFALILPHTNAEAAEVAAERGRAAVASLPGALDASFGIAVWPADAGSKDSLLERADARLYEMKRAPAGKRLPDG
jgi:diguanylate cyclase (GGDEF)-like protein